MDAAERGVPQTQAQQQRSGSWSSGLFDVHHDEETCWWGCWCPWLLQGRTVHSYDLATSFKANASYWGAIFLFLLLVLAGGPLGFLLGIGVIGWLVHRGATWRRQIREAEGIEGDFSSDCMIHCCCSPCAVCQEARQAKHSQRPVLDFCSGEDLTSQHERYEAATESSERGGSLLAHLASLSQTSRLILGLCGLLFLIAVLANAKTPMNILVLLLTFVEPFLFLYFVYWRKHRAYASLDMVVKMFSVGFWFSTTVAMIIEQMLQIVLGGILIMIAGVTIEPATDEPEDNDSKAEALGRVLTRAGIAVFGATMGVRATEGEGEDPGDASGDSEEMMEEIRKKMRENFGLVVVGLFIMAFVIAAGVEETVKHFVVRCCQFPAPLKEPRTILIYLMSGALGFATMENIMYVFSSGNSVNAELTVLAMRAIMPIHVICSALQAVNLSKVLVDQQSMSLLGVLAPAIVLHGVFDFILFLVGAIAFVYKVETIGLEIGTFVGAIAITVIGAAAAYTLVKRQEQQHTSGWRRFQNQDDFGDVQL